MPKETYDAVIIGAGPAGSTAAFILASAGLKVALLDRCDFPRPKLCGGLLTWKTVRLVEKVFQVHPQTLINEGIIHHTSRAYRVCSRSGRNICRRLDDPFHLVDRRAYDHFFLNQAVAAGADFYPGSAIAAIDLKRCMATTRAGEKWTGRFLLGADGINSLVRRTLCQAARIEPPRYQGPATALECFVAQPPPAVSGPPAIYYGFIPWGYGWSFPGPRERLVGMAALKAASGRRIGACFEDFLKSLGLPTGPNRLRIRAHRLPFGNYVASPGHAQVLLTGDAAGLADPFLGEGIYYAHRSAQLAAQAITQSRSHPESAFPLYRQMYRRFIYPELRYARAGRHLIFSLPPSVYFPLLAGLLRLFPKTCEETVQGRRSFQWFRRRRLPP